MTQFFFVSIVLFLTMVMILMNIFLSDNYYNEKEKNFAFECGMENKYSSRFHFSLQFFMICIIFILFDVELVILFNFISFFESKIFFFFIMMNFILFFIFFTLLIEWKMKTLKWIF